MYDVITVGSATVDVYAKTEFSELLKGKNKEDCIAYPVGSKILINELTLTSGGGGTNTAVALARLGHKVAFLGKIGSKENSKRVNNDLKFNEIKLKKLRTKWFYFSTMMEESFRTLEKLASYAVKNDIKIMFNISSYLAKKGTRYLGNILKKINILVLNKEEACILVGRNSIESLLKKLRKLGPEIVAVTDGKHGVYVFSGNCLY